MWRGASYMVHPTGCNLCGASYVVQSTRRNPWSATRGHEVGTGRAPGENTQSLASARSRHEAGTGREDPGNATSAQSGHKARTERALGIGRKLRERKSARSGNEAGTGGHWVKLWEPSNFLLQQYTRKPSMQALFGEFRIVGVSSRREAA